jgi:hypothetical protein
MKTTFDEWMKLVDLEILKLCGMTSDDLPDCCYGDWYKDDVTPKQAARRAIQNAK